MCKVLRQKNLFLVYHFEGKNFYLVKIISYYSDGYTIGVGTTEGNILIMDLRYLTKKQPTSLKGHEGK